MSDQKEITRKKQLNFYFNKINLFFEDKRNILYKYKNFSLEDIMTNAPKYYSLIRMVEKVNTFVTKDSDWLKNFVRKNKINFDWESYTVWKAGKKYDTSKYTNTQAPSKWIYLIQDYFIDLLESLQILLTMEFYTDDDDFKTFLRKNPKVDYRMKANYMVGSKPSEDLDKIFEILDMLFKVDFEHDFKTHLIVDTRLCVQIYKKIDDSKVFDLLKKKEFYIKYRLEFLLTTIPPDRMDMPYEQDIIKIAQDFLNTIQEFRLAYREYKSRLIEKTQMAKRKTRRY